MSIQLRCCQWQCCRSARGICTNIRCFKLWKAVFAEMLASLILVLFGCGATVWSSVDQPTYVLTTSLAFGLAFATVVWCVADVSGGHVNPAVTFGMLVTGKLHFIPAVLYVAAQCVGGIVGAAYLQSVSPPSVGKLLGANELSASVLSSGAFGVEVAATFVLVLTFFASCDTGRNMFGSAPLSIGIAVIVGHLYAIPYTGCSTNPARTLGPALLTGIWANHWVFWIGPLFGGALGALTYEHLFSTVATPATCRKTCMKAVVIDDPETVRIHSPRVGDNDVDNDDDSDDGDGKQTRLHRAAPPGGRDGDDGAKEKFITEENEK